MSTRLETLTGKVAAVNQANEVAILLKAKLDEFFRPLVGQKIVKIDGSLLGKYADQVKQIIEQIEAETGIELIYRLSSQFSLGWVCKACKQTSDHGCTYYEQAVYVGDYKGQTLEKIDDRGFNLRTDFTVAEMKAKFADVETTKKAYEAAKSKLWPFYENEAP